MSTLSSLPFSLQTILLLMASNVIMTMARYGVWAAFCMVGAVYFVFRNA